MALSFIGQATGTTSATLPSHQAGDLIIAFAYRDGNTTAPALPAGWINIANAGANTNSARLAYKIAASGSETATGFTNATSLVVHVYRSSLGAGRVRPGAFAAGGAASTNVAYNALTMVKTDGTSWVAGFAGHRSIDTNLQNAPTGMTNRSTVVDATDEAAGHDTDGTVSSWSTQSVSVGGTSSGWRSYTVEIREIADPDMLQRAGGGDNGVDATTIACTLPESVTAGNLLVAMVTWGDETDNVDSITDTLGNTWTQIGDQMFDADVNQGSAFFYTVAGSSGANTVTANFINTCDFRGIVVAEYYGANTVLDEFDQNESQTATGGAAASPSITPTENGCLIVGAMINTHGGTTANPVSPFFEAIQDNNSGGALQQQWTAQATAASIESEWVTNSGQGYNSHIASFKTAGGGGPTNYDVSLALAVTGGFSDAARLDGNSALALGVSGGFSDASLLDALSALALSATGGFAVSGGLRYESALALAATAGFDVDAFNGLLASLGLAVSGGFVVDADGGSPVGAEVFIRRLLLKVGR